LTIIPWGKEDAVQQVLGMFSLKEAGKGAKTSKNVGGEKASNLNY